MIKLINNEYGVMKGVIKNSVRNTILLSKIGERNCFPK
jgi:hypothetical protein